jgi:FkbM family methyltransferase
MAGPARRLALPNGLEVAYQSKAELQQFYDDIFEKRVYTRRGIRLRDGDCVFDVGANIGLFTLYAAHHHPGARIFSFEPAPPVFELLKANTAGLGGRVRLFNCGLGARPGRATLTFYPHSSGMSSFYPDEAQEKAALRILIRGELARRAEVEQILPHEDELLEQRFRSESWTCELLTLSGVLQEHGVDCIDLLKIDVEKSEMDVLAGLSDEDWPRVSQIVAEVHDMGDRLRELPALLRSRGFEVELEQDELYRGSDRWNLYAARPRPAAVAVPAWAAVMEEKRAPEGIAVVGMAGRFPGAPDLDAYWRNLCNGTESITFFTREELRAVGVEPSVLDDPRYVPARGVVQDIELFDAAFFGLAPREAEIADPQHRLFLECAWEALENAGYDASSYPGLVGIFGGMSTSYYFMHHLLSRPGVVAAAGPLQTRLYNDKDFLASLVAFKLGLTGPSITVQTACSTSLVATCLACQSLLAYQCDMVLAGGVCVTLPQKVGYLVVESVTSPDGHCRAFDAAAQGTVAGDGVGMVVLKRLADALADRDTIHAVIKGFATNNDGALKLGYAAPGMEGQIEVVAMAQAMAGVDPATIGYVEAHGTATPLGDPVEVAALAEVFAGAAAAGAVPAKSCALGSVKTNIGHLDAAAGVASLIKAVLAVERGVLPPSLHFQRPNPQIDFASTPFYVNSELRPWRPVGPRRAGVSSFALGGVNAHVVIEEFPPAPHCGASGGPWHLVPLSARSEPALDTITANLARHLRERRDLDVADVAWTLQAGRRPLIHRRFAVCRHRDDLIACLEGSSPRRLADGLAAEREILPAFLFPGLGNHHAGMGRDLYVHEPRFREVVDQCAEILLPEIGLDLRDVLYPEPADGEGRRGLDFRALTGRAAGAGAGELERTALSHPAVFVVEYALARLLMSWGITPQALLGFSIGEYVAACLAGVMSLEDALRVVARRACLIEGLTEGAMLAAVLPEDAARALAERIPDLALAAVAGPELCVLSGTVPAVTAARELLAGEGRVCRPLQTVHAFHSPMMEPVAGRLEAVLRGVVLRSPEIPFLSNVTGSWITAAQATDPTYWAGHLCRTVRFADGLRELWSEPGRALLEVGPGGTLSSWALQHPDASGVAVPAMRHALDGQDDLAVLLSAVGRLWLAGLQPDWTALAGPDAARRRVPLPTYPFERQRYWIEAGRGGQEPQDGIWMPAWKQAPPLSIDAGRLAGHRRWLLLSGGAAAEGLVTRLAERLEHEGALATIAPASALMDAEAHDSVLRGLPFDVVVDLRPLEGDPSRPFCDLLLLAQALVRTGLAHPVSLQVVTTGVHRVTGAETLEPRRAAVLGPCLTLPREHPQVSCQVVDVDLAGDIANLARDLIAEALCDGAEGTVAWRHGQRWTRILDPLRVEGNAPARLREGGTYLITGGLKGVGLALARCLVEQVNANLVLLSHAAPGPETEADLRRVRESGSQVLVLPADVTDEAAMRRALAAARERFGPIHGAVHITDVPAGGDGLVEGTLILDRLLGEGGDATDFLVLCSPPTGAFDSVDQAAGSAFLDAFAQTAVRSGRVVTSVSWDTRRLDLEKPSHQTRVEAEALARILSRAPRVPQLLISRDALHAPFTQGRPEASTRPATGGEPGRQAVSAPRNAVEETLAALWSKALRLDHVGIDDNFFELGGDSLLCIQVISGAAREGLVITLGQMFQHPTIAELAAVIGEASPVHAEQRTVTDEAPLSPRLVAPYQEPEADAFTPADFPEAELSDADFSKLMSRLAGGVGEVGGGA